MECEKQTFLFVCRSKINYLKKLQVILTNTEIKFINLIYSNFYPKKLIDIHFYFIRVGRSVSKDDKQKFYIKEGKNVVFKAAIFAHNNRFSIEKMI